MGRDHRAGCAFRRRHRAADQHGRARLRRRLAGGCVLPRPGGGRHHPRDGRWPRPHHRRRHLSLRDRPGQRHDRPDSRDCREGCRRPSGADPVGDVRGHRGAHRDRRGQPGGVRDHRPDRPRLRRPLRHQPVDDGHDGRPRRPGGRLLADQHLRHHHQLGDGERRASQQRADDLLRQPRGQHDPRGHPVLHPRRPLSRLDARGARTRARGRTARNRRWRDGDRDRHADRAGDPEAAGSRSRPSRSSPCWCSSLSP